MDESPKNFKLCYKLIKIKIVFKCVDFLTQWTKCFQFVPLIIVDHVVDKFRCLLLYHHNVFTLDNHCRHAKSLSAFSYQNVIFY